MDTDILIPVLAATDAIWRPFRRPLSRAWGVVYERRRTFLSAGIQIQAGGDEKDRKRRQRRTDEMVRDGLLQAVRSGGRTVGLRLTDRGDHHARSAADLPLADASLVRELIGNEADPRCVDLGGLIWHSEQAIVGPDRLAAEGLADVNLPHLVRGWLVSRSDVAGRIWLAVTKSGRAAIASTPRKPRGLPKRDPAAVELYRELLGGELSRLDTGKREDLDIGEIPFPVSPPVLRPGAAAAWAEWRREYGVAEKDEG